MKTKILIAGIGGVGGYYGGLLAQKYANNPDIEIYFLARGQHLEQMQQHGLKLITEGGTYMIHPTLATDNILEIGKVDYLIITTKAYDLDKTIEQLKPCIENHTVILPLLNGIDITDRISRLLPKSKVWYGCVYIVARLKEPGVVESSGNVHGFNFGSENLSDNQLLAFQKILVDAGIEARLSDSIKEIIWTKFFFISPTASLTSYFDVSFGELITDSERKDTLIKMLEELLLIAKAEGSSIDCSIVEKIIQRLEVLPLESTSSMHSDFNAGRQTELKTLTGIVIDLGKKNHISTPIYQKVFDSLSKK